MMLKLSPSQRKKTSHLAIEQTIYVPSTKKGQKTISKATMNKRVNEIKRYLSTKFGGFTTVQASGGYTMPNKKIVQEKVVKVTSFATGRKFNQNKTALLRKLRKLGERWGQDSIGYEHEGDMYYIKSGLKKKIKRKIKGRKKK